MKKIKNILIALTLLLISGFATAQRVEVTATANGLKTAIDAQTGTYSDIKTLVVNGTIDARDFLFLRNNFNSTLDTLDLSNVSIAAYSGAEGTWVSAMGSTGSFDYAANILPNNAFYDSRTNKTTFTLKNLKLPTSLTEIAMYSCFGLTVDTLDLSSLVNLKIIQGQAFNSCKIKRIVFPSNLTTINDGIFLGSSQLQSIEFLEPASITSFPAYLFSSLASLKYILIPSSITNITGAFNEFKGDSIGVSPNNPKFASYQKCLYSKALDTILIAPTTLTSLIFSPNIVAIGNSMLAGTETITPLLVSVTIPATVTTIGNKAFQYCKNLTTVLFENGSQLKNIGTDAFWRSGLTAITLPTGLQTINSGAFQNINLSTISIPASVTSIGANAFSHNSDLTTVDMSNSTLTTTGTNIFSWCDKLTNVTLPNSLKTLNSGIFTACFSLKTITLPNSLTAIKNSAFSSSGLTSIILPENLQELGESSFNFCDSLLSLNIPRNVNTIGVKAFTLKIGVTVDSANAYFSAENGILYNKNKSKLIQVPTLLSGWHNITETVDTIVAEAFSSCKITSVTLPLGLKHIGSGAFSSCSQLTKINVLNPTPIIILNSSFGSDIFEKVTLCVPEGTIDAYKAANNWKKFTKIEIIAEESFFKGLDLGYCNGMSPDGKYIVGSASSGGYVYEIGATDIVIIPNSEDIIAATNDGVFTGTFIDSNYRVGSQYLTNGGVYKNNKWYSLGLGRYGATTNTLEAYAVPAKISADGTVWGFSMQKGTVARILPFTWSYNQTNDDYVTDTQAYTIGKFEETTIQGSRFTDVAYDGGVAVGWAADGNGNWHTAIWESPTDCEIVPNSMGLYTRNISANGKYVSTSIDGKGAIYNIETKKTSIIGGPNSRISAISDNGLVFGYTEVGDDISGRSRTAFAWSEDIGFMWFGDFLDKFAPGMRDTIEDQTYFNFNGGIIDVVSDVSIDGKIIAGWSGYTTLARKSWAIKIGSYRDILPRPKNPVANVVLEDRNKVVITWEEPVFDPSHTLDFYDIYRNNEKIARVDAYDGTTYTDNNSPIAFENSYYVTAIYDYETASKYGESGISDVVYVEIVDNYDLPFIEDFEYGQYSSFRMRFWKTQSIDDEAIGWSVYPSGGFQNPFGKCALLSVEAKQTKHQHILTSKPLDARSDQTITLSFLYTIISEAETFPGIKDTVFIEVSSDPNGNTWSVADYMLITTRTMKWTPYSIDISSLAQNKLFRVRLRYSAGANRTTFYIKVDNFHVSTSTATTPEDVIAYRRGNSNVRLVIKDETNSYSLGYAQSEAVLVAGNNGNNILFVNQHDAFDLYGLKGKYITSVSAYINAAPEGSIVPTRVRVVVYDNDVRVYRGESISPEKENAWNTFRITTPILIEDQTNLKIGLELFSHDADALPIAHDGGGNFNPKGNIYSEDNGKTWLYYNDYKYIEETDTFSYPVHWLIRTNIRNSNAVVADEYEDNVVGYEIYRDGEKINTDLFFNPYFTDTNNSNAYACYTVKKFSVDGLSATSLPVCVEDYSSIQENIFNNTVIFPNPTSTELNIHSSVPLNLDCIIYDVSGKKVSTLKLLGTQSKIDVSNLKKGTYFLNTNEGTIKFVKK
ncbi:hypothetical protein FACS1894153_2390 [Bacteroidia bacterium]|nr:hypothetical protein FACS1894153_2390 [Bacteroidia bacterium]